MGRPRWVMAQTWSRCSGSEIIGELMTSSTVTTSRKSAFGLCCACCEAATLIQASCALVVPYWCMCRMAAIPYWFATVGPYGYSNGASGDAATGGRGTVAGGKPPGGGGAVRIIERRVGRRSDGRAWHGAGGHALGARAARERDERDVALAEGDRLGRVRDVDDVGRPAGARRGHVAEVERQVMG